MKLIDDNIYLDFFGIQLPVHNYFWHAGYEFIACDENGDGNIHYVDAPVIHGSDSFWSEADLRPPSYLTRLDLEGFDWRKTLCKIDWDNRKCVPIESHSETNK